MWIRRVSSHCRPGCSLSIHVQLKSIGVSPPWVRTWILKCRRSPSSSSVVSRTAGSALAQRDCDYSITHTLLKWLIDLLPDWESLINELICLWFGRHSYESNLRQIGLNLNWVLSCCKTAWHPQETYGTIEEAWRKAFDDLTACLPTWANLLAKLSRSKLCTGIESQYLLSSVCSAENVFFFKPGDQKEGCWKEGVCQRLRSNRLWRPEINPSPG